MTSRGPDGDWRALWRREHKHVEVAAAALAVLPGDPLSVVVTEAWAFDGVFAGDNTKVYRLADGAAESDWIMSEQSFDTPRVETARVGDGHVCVVNTGRGVVCFPPTPVTSDVQWALDPEAGGNTLGGVSRDALDLVVGRRGDRSLVVAAWDLLDGTGPYVQAFDLISGAPVARPWRLPASRAGDWRLGRRDGRPVAAAVDGALLHVRCAVTGAPQALIRLPTPPVGVLAVDDRAGPTLILLGAPTGVVCYDLAAEAVHRPQLSGYHGKRVGARLGRWRGRPVAAVLTDSGLSLYDLSASPGRGHHLDVRATVHDVAFTEHGRMAVATSVGPMLIEM
ncbi:hypothetical protein NLX83_22315 [Allokutzneria sp. A3M-2-11 16]|uniref:hypothetical protein n=1 Tax=Allokutzneria sp. A3M-2-11 16 TaxID=2962043 RepID=UPI0020B6987F|nr:hypothetical protein [Allokutzneria sp. A3M-2-11 16]MCP3802004.1 hypothetical protein [Allokutzneria sp. A3M-2-11 16]